MKRGSTTTEECERILKALREQGYRLTGPRRALVRVIVESDVPLSVQEIHASANAAFIAGDDVGDAVGGDGHIGGEEINLVTVYRFANLLVDLRLIRRVEFGEGYYRYERDEPQDGPHHHRLICQSCGKIEDFAGCDIAQTLTARVEAESGFKLRRHQLELYGTCSSCQ